MAPNDKIKDILTRYWEGESTVDEELLLAEYFTQSDIDPELLVYQPLFRYFEVEKDTASPAGFEANLMRKIAAPVIQLDRPVRKFNFQILMRTAAGIALAIGTIFVIDWNQYKTQQLDLYADTYEAPEAALAGLKSALIQVSDQIDGSSEIVHEQFKKLEDSQTISF